MASSPDGRRLVTIEQAAVIARVSRRTMYLWMDTEKVGFVRTAGGSRRIFVDTLFRTPDGAPLPTSRSAELLGKGSSAYRRETDAPTPAQPPLLRSREVPAFPHGPLVPKAERPAVGQALGGRSTGRFPLARMTGEAKALGEELAQLSAEEFVEALCADQPEPHRKSRTP